MPEPSSDRVAFANSLRGVAALCVLVQHYAIGYWAVPKEIGDILHVPPASIGATPAFLAAFSPPSPLALGSFGVALFFLISGFVIPFSLAKLSAGAFLVNRVFRIFPVYAAGLAITLAAIWLTGRYFGVAWSIEPTQIALHIPGLRDLVGIQSLDGIIWTLDIEIKFYVVCALGAPLFRRLSLRLLWLSAIVGMCSVLLWCAMLAIGQGNVTAETLAVDLAYMLFMFIGTTFYMLHSRKLQPMPAASIIVTLLSLHTLLLLPETGQALYNVNYAIALAVFAFAYAMRGRFGANRVTDFFAAISYPLYAVHAVMGWAILRVLTEMGMPPWAAVAIAAGAAIFVSSLLHRWIEMPAQAIGRVVTWRLPRPERSSDPAPASRILASEQAAPLS